MNLNAVMTREELEGSYTFRPAEREDMKALHELLLALEAVEDRGWHSLLDDRYLEFDEDKDPTRNSLLAFDTAGKLAAFSWPEMPEPEAQFEYRGFVWVEVHSDHRQGDLGRYMLNWGENRLAEVFAALPPKLPKVVRVGLNKDLGYHIELFEQAGYRPARYFYHMHKDISQPVSEPQLPADIRLAPWSIDLDRQAFDVFNTSFQDHWNFEPIKYERWQTWFSSHPEFLGDCCFLAMAGDKAVSICICNNRIGDDGEPMGWIRDVGTLREYRGRGLATGLMYASLKALQGRGYTLAGLGVDTENPTGALRIYERMGFEPARQFTMYEKKVA